MTAPIDLGCPELAADPAAVTVIKDEEVVVEFATAAGALASSVGLNHFRPGDALLTGVNGDRWCVSRDRFDVKYRPCAGVVAGSAGRYRNVPQPLLARQMQVPFRVARVPGGDLLSGVPGDWLVQYAPRDFGIVDRARFAQVYRVVAGR